MDIQHAAIMDGEVATRSVGHVARIDPCGIAARGIGDDGCPQFAPVVYSPLPPLQMTNVAWDWSDSATTKVAVAQTRSFFMARVAGIVVFYGCNLMHDKDKHPASQQVK